MKKSTNYYISSIIILMSCMPVFVFAENTTEKTKTASKYLSIPKANNFCLNFEEISTKLANDITEKEQKKKESEIKIAEKAVKKESESDAMRAKSRIDTDSKRIKTANKLNTKAKTESQKLAVEEYTKAIDNAVKARRSTIDTAVKTYQEGLSKLPWGMSTESEALFLSFKSSIESAAAKAVADCANKIPNKTASSSFNKSVKEARLKFNNDKNQLTQSSELKKLKDVRDAAFKQAEIDFKNATDKARADLV